MSDPILTQFQKNAAFKPYPALLSFPSIRDIIRCTYKLLVSQSISWGIVTMSKFPLAPPLMFFICCIMTSFSWRICLSHFAPNDIFTAIMRELENAPNIAMQTNTSVMSSAIVSWPPTKPPLPFPAKMFEEVCLFVRFVPNCHASPYLWSRKRRLLQQPWWRSDREEQFCCCRITIPPQEGHLWRCPGWRGELSNMVGWHWKAQFIKHLGHSSVSVRFVSFRNTMFKYPYPVPS